VSKKIEYSRDSIESIGEGEYNRIKLSTYRTVRDWRVTYKGFNRTGIWAFNRNL
jgi:hypothetical protein